MPGLSLLFYLSQNARKDKNVMLEALKSTIHHERYKAGVLYNDASIAIGVTSYDEYPITSFENTEFIVYLEGVIYNRPPDSIESELSDLVQIICSSSQNSKDLLSKWLLKSDGDFIILVIHKKSNRIFFINDAFSRLPAYYYKDDDQLIISRDLRFIVNSIDDVNFDKMSIAQTLLFGYALGKRTLIENIYRIAPSCLIEIDIDTSEISSNIAHVFNFEQKKNSDKSLTVNVNELASLFIEACKNRANSLINNKSLLSLSGGLDSRSVAAGLSKGKCNFSCVTRLSYDQRERDDAHLAGQLAKVFDAEWKVIHTAPPTGSNLLSLLRIKNGHNYLGMSLQIPYLHKVVETYGTKITFFTGDGGDKVFPDLRPVTDLKSIDALTEYIISNNKVFNLESVSALTGIRKDDIIAELKNYLLLYPESDFNQKYVHFIVYERGFKWLFEGEDRNRYYFWSVAPFWSVEFFNYAMNCLDKHKTWYKYYREFLLKLSPEATRVINKDWGISIASIKRVPKLLVRHLRYRVPLWLKDLARKYIINKGYKQSASVIMCLQEQTRTCEYIHRYLIKDALQSLSLNLNKTQNDYLFTVTSIIEDLTCKKSVLEKYSRIELK